jgi:hypothetical protein
MDYLLICTVSVVVAGLTFFSGFGLGTLLMPVFAVFFPIEIAIGATGLVHLANNAFKAILAGRYADPKIILIFAVPAAFAAVPGALLLNYFAAFPPLATYSLFGKVFTVEPVKAVVALLIIFFGAMELIPFFRRLSFNVKFLPVGGILSGFFGGLSGHQGALRTAFLVRAVLDKRTLIGTMVLSSMLVDISRLIIYGLTFFQRGFDVLQQRGGLGLVAAGSLSAFAGSFAGSRLLEKMTLDSIRTFIAVMLFLLAAALGLGIA